MRPITVINAFVLASNNVAFDLIDFSLRELKPIFLIHGFQSFIAVDARKSFRRCRISASICSMINASGVVAVTGWPAISKVVEILVWPLIGITNSKSSMLINPHYLFHL